MNGLRVCGEKNMAGPTLCRLSTSTIGIIAVMLNPQKAGVNGDVYYQQLVDNVRRFQGMSEPSAVSEPKQ